MNTVVPLSLGLIVALSSCEAGTSNSENEARLSLAGPANIELDPGGTVDLAWLLVRQSEGPEAGHTVVFTVISAATDHGSTISQPSGITDENGLASTTFQAGNQAQTLPIQVQGDVTSIPAGEVDPPPVSFTITIGEPLRILRPEPQDRDRYEGLTGGRVELAVRASSGGNRPIVGETISWEVLEGGSGGAMLPAPTSQTDIRGVAWGELACGTTPTNVTVRATLVGTEPVIFTIVVAEWGSCDDTHPCPTGWDCDSGSCVQLAPECTTDEQCGDGRRCRFGECVTAAGGDSCKRDEECDDGQTCVAGVCTGCEDVACPCSSVDDCPEGFACTGGECICEGPDCGGDPPCDEEDPDLAGFWDMGSTLHLRESLPDWLEGLLDAVDGVFRFLSDGILGGFDFDIPIIGGALEDAADSLVERYIPPWVGELMRAIADISDILQDLRIAQEMNLWGAGTDDQYLGTIEWEEVEMTWGGETVRGRFDDITGISVSHDSLEAEAICGTFYIHRHDMSIAFGSIVRWVLDVIITAVSDGEYFSLEEYLYDLENLCDDLADAIDELAEDLADGLGISLPDVYDIARRGCEAGVRAGTDYVIDWLEEIEVSADAMTLGGHATITSPSQLSDGRWDGTLLGGDFTGEFTARKR